MADVASHAGCSQATVSVVLNGTDSVAISDETKKAVHSAAHELGYKFQKRKRRRASATHGALAVYVNRFANGPEVPLAINGAREVCLREGRSVLVGLGFNDPVVDNESIQMLLSQNPVGLIYSEMTTRSIVPQPAAVEAQVPTILVNCHAKDDSLPCILPDEHSAGKTAGEFLISQGHERVAVITGETWMESAIQRLAGLRDALESHGLALRPEYVLNGNWHVSSGYENARILLSLDEPPTAIVCQNDKIALGVYLYAKECGVKIPQDLSVIGNDDEEFCRHVSPPLT
jgi:LacI family transcriptional regulator